MHNKQELIVPMDKDKVQFGLYVTLIMLLLAGVLLSMSFSLHSMIGYVLTIVVQSFLVGCIAIFSYAWVGGYFQIKDEAPMAILNERGIWVRQYGLINWEDISEIGIYMMLDDKLASIGIRVYDEQKLSQQAFSWVGKSQVFVSRICGHPSITLCNLAIENHLILDFARQFHPISFLINKRSLWNIIKNFFYSS
jgi:hypothetical protein